ncbi:MAG: histidine kinase [Nevskiaceae bacterium]|nr:MAG: histidine kinase [Nevskiaceae bacterium]TBR74712.1 MAG: histidine kinase [Nevskiaceae bacterium]
MAGIGFELRKLLRTQTYTGLIRSYGYAGLISSGPWVLSIGVIVALGMLSLAHVQDAREVGAFQVSVTYLVAVSLILSGLAQLVYTRYVADRLYEKRADAVLPNLIGVLTLGNVIAGAFAAGVILLLFGGTPLLYRVEMFITFVTLCNIWVLTVFLAGMKNYLSILWCFVAGYGTVLVLGLALRPWGLVGLLGAFCIGQAILLLSLLYLVMSAYPSDRLVEWDILRSDRTYRSLIFTGFFYNLGIWVDKFMFWYDPATSIPVIGPLRASPIYDFPMFLAYLSIVPGMAVFLIRMETDFAEHYDYYYDAIRQGDTLARIEEQRGGMIDTARQGIYEIFKIQGITIAILLLLAPLIMRVVGFSDLYVPLFDIDIVGVGAQLLLLAILNTLFYLNRLILALCLCALFVAGNFVLTWLSQRLGVPFYGYGFAVSLGLVSLVGLVMLSRVFDSLTYETFMLQAGPENNPHERSNVFRRGARKRGRQAEPGIAPGEAGGT